MKIKINKKICLRVLLGILILLNMAAIFLFSAQSGEESGKTSSRVTRAVAQITVKDFESKPPQEQERIVESLHPYVRKGAHMAEFGSLGALMFLFLLTWKGRVAPRYAQSIAVAFLYACTDELHQMLAKQRGPAFTDVLIDTLGALLCCSAILVAVLLHRNRSKGAIRSTMKTTRYYLSAHPDRRLRLAVVADPHGVFHPDLLTMLRRESPDLILIPGDLMEDCHLPHKDAEGYAFLRGCVAIAPTFYSLGNHEIGCYHSHKPWLRHTPTPLSDTVKRQIAETGAILLDNDCVTHGDLTVCGLTSGLNGKESRPDPDTLARFASIKGFRILLCHHPEYFVPYIASTDIELTVSGHAHGGQWRIFGRGVYAPGQGIFPKYTSGVIDGRCVISRGLSNHTHVPRIFNPPELVMVYYGYEPSEIVQKRTGKAKKNNIKNEK